MVGDSHLRMIIYLLTNGPLASLYGVLLGLHSCLVLESPNQVQNRKWRGLQLIFNSIAGMYS